MNHRLIDVALGNSPADLVIKGGKLVNVITKEIYDTDIAVADGKIAAVGYIQEGAIGPDTKIVDAKGKYMTPGFIDAHIHFESSMLTMTEFSKMAIKHGTTGIASDLMEIAIVAGREGIEAIFDEVKDLPVKLHYPVPAFMSEEGGLQTIGAALYIEMVEELISYPQAVGLAEVLYPPILGHSPASERMLEAAAKNGKTAEGHAPALFAEKLNAYITTGIRSDHESTSAEEALDKLRRGLRVLIREGCAAADLEALLPMLTEHKVDSRHCAMVSDDIDMLHMHEKGHLDHKVRMAVNGGVDPIEAIQMVTINPAESLKIDDRCGIIAPGREADIVFLNDLATCDVDTVISSGKVVVEGGQVVVALEKKDYAPCLLNTVKLDHEITADELAVKVDPSAATAKVRVIGANATSLLTDDLEADLEVKDGIVQADVERDILNIACEERYGKGGSIGRSFIKGFGISKGAIATSMGHDHHNITVVGSNGEDMATAVNRIQELQGGLVITENGKVKYELPLPICGLVSDKDGVECAAILKQMQEDLSAKGCQMQSPFMTLAFITLIFIPMYGITDKGLVDVLQGKLVDPVISCK